MMSGTFASQNPDIIDAGLPDADLTRAIRKARGAGITLTGAAPHGLGAEALPWIGALEKRSDPVRVTLSGDLGPRGLALLLMSDSAMITADASLMDGAQRNPMLAVLAARRLGPSLARQLLYSSDPLQVLRDHGFLTPETMAVAPALKLALTAASELPFSEALEFAAWLPEPSTNAERTAS